MVAPHAATPSLTAALAPGFADPVHDAQRCFRALMQTMARPGTIQAYANETIAPPTPLSRTLAALALTLIDYDTPIWLDPALAQNPAVAGYLKFHTGAPLAETPGDAAFALIGDPAALMPLSNFNQGTLEYPDRSTTLLMHMQTLDAAAQVTLEGPGIKTSQPFGAAPLQPMFWDQLTANNAQFPRGVDVIFAGATGFATVPRSTRITKTEA
ncbi:phosphonate C-P lyase system protein PhnH [Roseibium sp. CAU 1637]|uniref:Phosphonate C-P lyase system protein PhnH n=1 Tax=Roseibium limicola TaxID=2816037 RepID=A0A939ETD6_9HYPH|nr:phosphonate C-P lyase system protein PhnH [Roseibium limicola]MBO0346774.1 phosphonate C-P lyase system protein PhnH [Roseibium limicola]